MIYTEGWRGGKWYCPFCRTELDSTSLETQTCPACGTIWFHLHGQFDAPDDNMLSQEANP